MLLAEILIKLANMPINKQDLKQILNATTNCNWRSFAHISRDTFDEAMNNIANYRQLSMSYGSFISTHAIHIKTMTYTWPQSYRTQFICCMSESRHLQASHRSSSHRPSDDSIHYKAYSIRLLSKQATVEVYCIHTRQLLYSKQFDKPITNVYVIAAAYDYWVVHANLIDDDQQSKTVECLISVDDICSYNSATVNIQVIKYPSQSSRYILKYATSRRVVYSIMGGNLPSSIQLACL